VVCFGGSGEARPARDQRDWHGLVIWYRIVSYRRIARVSEGLQYGIVEGSSWPESKRAMMQLDDPGQKPDLRIAAIDYGLGSSTPPRAIAEGALYAHLQQYQAQVAETGVGPPRCPKRR
jgi:hypothetical protein